MNRPEQIRKEILLQLYACRPVALSTERITRDAQKQGYDFLQAEIVRELQFLVDEELALEFHPRGSTAKLYRISGDGVRQYEQKFVS